MPERLKFFYNPRSRAATVRWMLEEVGADYEIVRVEFDKSGKRDERLVAANPMGKVPTLLLADGTVVTEASAICMHLADAYPDAGMAPEPGSSDRASYYRWLCFVGSAFEPALIETMMRKDAPPLDKTAVGWSTYDEVIDTVEDALRGRDFLVGGRMSAADVYMGSMLSWATSFGGPRLADSEPIKTYVAHLQARPAYKRGIAEAT